MRLGDRGTKMYYGGDPAAWTVQPSLPKDALFDAASLSQKAPPRKSGRASMPIQPPALTTAPHTQYFDSLFLVPAHESTTHSVWSYGC